MPENRVRDWLANASRRAADEVKRVMMAFTYGRSLQGGAGYTKEEAGQIAEWYVHAAVGGEIVFALRSGHVYLDLSEGLLSFYDINTDEEVASVPIGTFLPPAPEEGVDATPDQS